MNLVSFFFIYRSRDHDQKPYFFATDHGSDHVDHEFETSGGGGGVRSLPKTPVPGHRERPPLLALASVEGAVTHPDVQPPAKLKTWHLFACAWGTV